MAATLSSILWFHFCTTGENKDMLSIFIHVNSETDYICSALQASPSKFRGTEVTSMADPINFQETVVT